MRRPKNEYWLLAAALIITAVYASQAFYGNIVISTSSTLFNILFQILCTILILVFNIVLVAAQIGSRYSQETMDLIFSKYTILYMFSYLMSILFCLYGLSDRSENINIVRMGNILAIMNFSLLIPFIYTVKEKLKTRNLLTMLSKRVIEAKKKDKPFEKYLNAIDNIIYSSYKDLDFETFNEGIRKLLTIYIEIPEPGDRLTRTIMKTLEHIDSLNFQEERSTDITMDALRDAALECLDSEEIDSGEKVEKIIIELRNLLEQVDDIRLKIKYLSKSWGRMTEIFDSCIKRGRPEMVYQVYYRTFSMIGFYLFTLHRIARDVPELKGRVPEELAALPGFAQVEIMKIVEPGFEFILSDLVSVIGKWIKDAEEEGLSKLRDYCIDLLTEIGEKSEKDNLIFQSKKISELCNEILEEVNKA